MPGRRAAGAPAPVGGPASFFPFAGPEALL